MFSPYVYGIVFKGTIYHGADLEFERKFKMMKIGFTQCTLKQIKKRIKVDRDENIALIFFVVKSAVDTARHHDFEERIIVIWICCMGCTILNKGWETNSQN